MFFSESIKDDINNISKFDGDEQTLDDIQISKFSLQIISKKIKKGIKGKEIEKIKKKDFELLEKYQDQLDKLNSKFKKSLNNKTNLRQFVKEVCTIDKKGQLFKVLMKL